MLEINLKKLIQNYDQNLLDNLRGFGKNNEFLNFWVPDTDEYKSFLNLIDALIESKILNVKIILDKSDEINILLDRIETFLLKISDYKKIKNDKYFNLEIKINKNKYDNFQIKKTNLKNNIKKQELDKTKHLSPYGIKELITLEYKKNLNLFDPTSFYSSNAKGNENCYIEKIENILIKLEIKKNIIVNISHNSNKKEILEKLIDMFFEIIIKKNIQEAAEHGTIYLEEKIRLIDNKIISSGIILPGQAGYYFKLINSCIRKIFLKYRLKNKIELDVNKNYYETSQAWKVLDDYDKYQKINLVLNDICRNYNLLTQDSIKVNKIENNFKIYLNVDKDFMELQKEKNILLEIEIKLKQLDSTLEVFIDEILDQNKLRLKNSPQNLTKK